MEGIAEWLDIDVEKVHKIYDELEAEDLIDRKVMLLRSKA